MKQGEIEDGTRPCPTDADHAELREAKQRIGLLGTMPLLLMLAATGVLRGLQTPGPRWWSRSPATRGIGTGIP